jgi:hypothetical protein
MDTNFVLKEGIYKVSWEDGNSSYLIETEVKIPAVKSEQEVIGYLKKELKNFDKLKGEKPLIFIRDVFHKNRQIAIIDINDDFSEFEINELLDKDYSIREFHNGKCIMQNKKIMI